MKSVKKQTYFDIFESVDRRAFSLIYFELYWSVDRELPTPVYNCLEMSIDFIREQVNE